MLLKSSRLRKRKSKEKSRSRSGREGKRLTFEILKNDEAQIR
jgi:hypothetical protein